MSEKALKFNNISLSKKKNQLTKKPSLKNQLTYCP